jgi:hypothetical protein
MFQATRGVIVIGLAMAAARDFSSPESLARAANSCPKPFSRDDGRYMGQSTSQKRLGSDRIRHRRPGLASTANSPWTQYHQSLLDPHRMQCIANCRPVAPANYVRRKTASATAAPELFRRLTCKQVPFLQPAGAHHLCPTGEKCKLLPGPPRLLHAPESVT